MYSLLCDGKKTEGMIFDRQTQQKLLLSLTLESKELGNYDIVRRVRDDEKDKKDEKMKIVVAKRFFQFDWVNVSIQLVMCKGCQAFFNVEPYIDTLTISTEELNEPWISMIDQKKTSTTSLLAHLHFE